MLRLNYNENVLAVYRRHWLVLLRDVFVLSFIGIFLLGAGIALKNLVPDFFASYGNKILFWLAILFFQGLWLALFVRFSDYWLDAWIITSERIIDIEQKGLFKREISEFKLDRVQDVSVDISGIIQTFFNFGNVHVETAGSTRNFLFKTVSNPQKIKSKILYAHDNYIQLQGID
jgi:uncharacterized membrane protein YdbT with pleckstrin-like domain